MNEDYIIAYHIVNTIAKKTNVSTCEILNHSLFNIRRTDERCICIHQILSQTNLRLKQVAKMFNLKGHDGVIYYREKYFKLIYIGDRKFKQIVKLAS